MSLFFSATANKKATAAGAGVGFVTSVGNSGHFISGSNGRAWSWGANNSAQLGDNSITQRNTPVNVLGAVKTFCKIAAGPTHVLAITHTGRVWAWGNNSEGMLGDNTITSRQTPVSVLGAVKTFCQISGGLIYSVALDKNGRAWGWGRNAVGQLGDNTITSRQTPVSVLGAVKTFCKISTHGGDCTLAIDKNGRVWGWGGNAFGQIGDNTITSKLTPVSVLGAVKTFCHISGGQAETALALDKNGRAWGWGRNGVGQIGDNTITSKLTPVSVLGAVKTFCKISTSYHTVAIDKNGRAWAWGYNFYGQLGNNTGTDSLTPVSVLGAVKTFCEIVAGITHTLAVDKNGRVWAWGNNGQNELGDTTFVSRLTPVRVYNL